ncbi:MAG: hypothetical protein PHG97_02545 [Candidatus Margulisbacteria bacterium]|nr:hypothetical protein [Candidatus Margulisiibacteriota bacterium]
MVQAVNNQQINVALNEGAILNQAVIPKHNLDKPTETKRTAREVLEKALSGGGIDKKGKLDMVLDTLAKLPSIGLSANVSTKGVLNKLDQEYDRMLGKDDTRGDTVALSRSALEDAITGVEKYKGKKGREEGENSGSQGVKTYTTDSELKGLVQQYSSLFLESMVSNDSGLAAKLKTLKDKILEKGVPEKEIIALELKIKNEVRKQITNEIKERYTAAVFAEGNLEDASAKLGLYEFTSKVFKNNKLGNWDFGGYHDGIQGTSDFAGKEAKAEIKDFLMQELEKELIGVTMKDGKKDLSTLSKIAVKAENLGADIAGWTNRVWKQEKNDLGLTYFNPPDGLAGNNVNTNAGDLSRQPKNPYEYTEKDEKELLVNRLRAVYMQRAIKGDLLTTISTELKVRKLKNGIFRLGIFTDQMEEQIKGEAQELAKQRTMEMLNEALLERATLYELSGPAHQMVETRIKGLLKNLKRLDLPVSDANFVRLRDQANARVFSLAKKELIEVKQAKTNGKNPSLDKKEGLLKKLMQRIMGETRLIN